jgi:hypothetical protein
MTGYWNADRLDLTMARAMMMGMGMVMMCSKRKPPTMPPSHDKAHTRLADFKEITVSNSDNDLQLRRATSARFDGRMPDIPEVEI